MEKFKRFTKGRLVKYIFIYSFFFFCFLCSSAQAPVIKTSVDKTSILIGEHFKYNVQATFPSGAYQLNWFDIPDSIEHFEVVTRGKIDTTEDNGIIHVKQQITLTSFDSGENTLPPFGVNLDPLSGDSILNLITDSLVINVAFSPMDSSKTFHDIKSIIEVKDEWPLWMWILLGASILIAGLIIYFLIKRIRRKKTVPLFNTKLSPLEEAMQALQQLQQDQLLAKKQIKQFHIGISDIFKRFISRKTNRNMLNLTSSEILVFLNTTLSATDISLLANSLRMSDAVKFAKYLPPEMESEKAIEDMKNDIRQADRSIINNNS